MNNNNISVTRFVSSFFPPFVAEEVIAKMMASPNWPKSPYFGKTEAEIIAIWKEKARYGAETHAQIERFFVEGEKPDTPTPEFANQFLPFEKKIAEKGKMDFLVAEKKIQSLGLSGIIDAAFFLKENPNEIVLIDWKVNAKLPATNFYEKGKPPIEHLQNAKLVVAQLQLNAYKAMWENSTDQKVKHMFVVQLHKNLESYKVHRVPDFQKEIKDMLASLPKEEAQDFELF